MWVNMIFVQSSLLTRLLKVRIEISTQTGEDVGAGYDKEKLLRL